MTAELMVYALVAAGLIFWLRSILGTRGGDEPDQRPPVNLELSEDGKIINLDAPENKDELTGNVKQIEELAQNPKDNMSIAGRAAEGGLMDIVNVDREFDVKQFLRASQDAFVFIVESFAEGDRDTLNDLLGPGVYNAFDKAITEREKAGETMMTEIQSIQKAEIIEAKLTGKSAFITVRFWAEETSVVKDEDGNVVSGHPDRVTQMRDVWTFTRNLKSRDPRWLVVETREDGEGDNESIPNTH